MGNTIKPHIERAEKTGTCNLTKQGLAEFPGELLRVAQNLRTLDLSENKLPAIPPAIGNFTMLKSLNLAKNRLGSLPEEIGKLKKLEFLSLANNRLTSIPTSMSTLSSLRDVTASHNLLTVFPTQFSGLKHLDSLDLSHNRISEVPDTVHGLEVIEINLNQNQISRLSEKVAQCPRLKVLRVEENCLEVAAFTPAIMKESKVALLAAEGNLFDMKMLHEVDGYEEYMERYTATKKKFN